MLLELSRQKSKNKMKKLTRFMPLSLLLMVVSLSMGISACSQSPTKSTSSKELPITNIDVMTDSNDWNELTPEEKNVIVYKGTEYAWTGEFVDHKEEGVYTCRRCNNPLFRSDDKFDSRSGWPSFDDAIDGGVKEVPDADGQRTEIVCNNCGGHLGHVFKGEGFTDKNTRHCVNSISMSFVNADELSQNVNNMNEEIKTDTAIFASGCFWGTEYHFEKAEGVISTQVGYIGGHVDNPTYEQVCAHTTGHAEAVMVVFDPSKTDYETLCKLFFETHDPTQLNRQGPDIGDQYRSEVFYTNEEQKETTLRLIQQLKDDGLDVVTKVTPASTFWDAEDYHEHYYSKKNGTPYCHAYTKRFD